MNDAGWWQAAAEIAGVLLVLLNGVGGLFLYRMQAKFVTRAEHHEMVKRVDGLGEQMALTDKTIAGLFTNEKAAMLTEQIAAVRVQNAQLIGQLPELKSSIDKLAHQTNMLIQNELEQSGKKS